MTTRRNFLKGAGSFGGLIFCGCGLPFAAHAQGAAAPARLPVTVKGKKLKTIDPHSHCFIQAALDASGDKMEAVQTPGVLGIDKLIFTPDQRMKEMDAMAIDMEILSINPWWYGKKDREVAEKITNLHSRTRSSPSSPRSTRSASARSRRSRCNFRISPCGSSKTP